MGFNHRSLITLFAIFWTTQLWGQIVINEICPANADLVYDPDYFNFKGWVEVYNSGASSVDISGYFLSDDELNKAKWQIPPGTILAANSYLIIWCDKKDSGLHTNFSLDSDGEEVVLSNASQVIVDKITFPKQYTNVSYGRLNNSATIGYLTLPTYNAANNGSTGITLLENPTVSLLSGRYASSQTATITHATPNVVIRYTLDGSEPTHTSAIYTSAISITQTLTLKAKAYLENFLPSKAEVKTYFINEHNFTLPVVSISTNPDYLFSDNLGMYVIGTNGVTGHCMDTPVNWNQDWDRHAVFEFFDSTGDKKFDQGVDIRIGGDCTRPKPQKSFAISADDKYGRNHINEKLFDNKDAERYAGFMYRNSGNDNNILHFRDALIQHIAGTNMDVDYMDYKPTIHYLNGEYWGIQNMREKIDGDFIESNYGISKDDIDLIEKYKTVIEGTDETYRSYFESLQLMDMTEPASFDFVDEHIDVQEYINYLVTEIYVANTDWPGNNMKFWRQRSTNGKFRWILWDTDFGLGFNSNPSDHPTLKYATTPGTSGATSGEATVHIQLMLQNPIFKERFITTLTTAMSSIFSPTNFNNEVEIFQNRLKDEMPYHKARWGGTMEEWENYIQKVKTFMAERQPFMMQHITEFFGRSTESVMLNFYSNTPGAGTFYLNNSIHSPVVNGPYFKGDSYTVKAIPSSGYTFSHWNISKESIKPITVAQRGDSWKYFDQGALPGDWMNTSFVDTAWPVGIAELGYGDGDETTVVSYGGDPANKYITTYFRKTFTIDGADIPTMEDLSAAINFDDGVVVYVNGIEVYRNNMPAGTIDFSTEASVSRTTEGVFETFTVDKDLLQAGNNVVAIEVHQSNPSSSDLSFDFEMSTTVNGNVTETTSSSIEITDVADAYTTMEAVFEPVTAISGLIINEVNATSSGITDNFGDLEDWIELYNTTASSIDIAGLYITDDVLNKTKYQIPPGTNDETVIPANSYKILWADEETYEGVLHLNFKLSADGEAVGLYQTVGDNIVTLAEVTFPAQPATTAFARIPNITGPFMSTEVPTPGSENMLEVLTGLDEDISLHISVYPNPANNEINVTSDALIHQVSLYNIHGMKIQEIEMYSVIGNLSLATFPTGLYLLQVETEKGSKTIKVLKK